MSHKIVYATKGRTSEAQGAAARVLRALILLGVWILVAIAALAAWSRFTA